jgi:Raf kinase inhibitor-like YbhB/YbcL family protein
LRGKTIQGTMKSAKYSVCRLMMAAGLILITLLSLSCKGSPPPKAAADQKGAAGMEMKITSAAFIDGARIPKKYSCEGQDISPPLNWTGVPQNAKSLALICDDPDAPAGIWTHWVLWNMPPSTPSLPEGVPTDAMLPGGIKQGQNSWPTTGYKGPCPPPGKAHGYQFKLFALDSELNLPDKADKAALETAMKGHILAQARIIGTYGR